MIFRNIEWIKQNLNDINYEKNDINYVVFNGFRALTDEEKKIIGEDIKVGMSNERINVIYQNISYENIEKINDFINELLKWKGAS